MNDPNGRYAQVEVKQTAGPDGRPIAYLARRFVPDPADLKIVGRIAVEAGDRLDLLAGRALGAPSAWWRIADAARAIHAEDLEAPPGRRLDVPLPEPGK